MQTDDTAMEVILQQAGRGLQKYRSTENQWKDKIRSIPLTENAKFKFQKTRPLRSEP